MNTLEGGPLHSESMRPLHSMRPATSLGDTPPVAARGAEGAWQRPTSPRLGWPEGINQRIRFRLRA